MKNPNWTREELILALDLYLKTKGRPSAGQCRVLSSQLRQLGTHSDAQKADNFRNAGSVRRKIENFRRFDPIFIAQGSGISTNGGQLDGVVWTEFAGAGSKCHEIALLICSFANQKKPDDLVELEMGITEAPEGRLLTHTHQRRERNSALVRASKQRFRKVHGRLFCEACGFDPTAVYGGDFDKIIECHHLKPISELKPGDVTSIEELVMLCPSCHRVIHAHTPWLTIAQLKQLLSNT